MFIPPLSSVPREQRLKYVRYAAALGMRDANKARKPDGAQFAHESLLYYAYLNAWRDSVPTGWTAYTHAEQTLINAGENKMEAPKTLNGYPVIKSEVHANCVTVMMDAAHKFIVATWWPELGATWSWGHYHHHNSDTDSRNDARDDADASFYDAAKRNATR